MTAASEEARAFAHRMIAMGFRVWLSGLGGGDHGFLSDKAGSRALSFSFRPRASLSGNYGPPSSESGTGWEIYGHPGDLDTPEKVREALYAHPPSYCGKGWRYLSTAEHQLAAYGNSSKYAEIEARK